MKAVLPTLIFDLDGTLTDPREGIARCYAHALESLGMEVPAQEVLEKFIGPPVYEVFRDLLKTQDEAQIQDGISRYRARYTDIGLFENFVYEGIPEVLAQLRSQGYDLMVCTSKPWTFAERILERFELRDYFGPVYGPELDGTRGHKVELLAHLLKLEKLTPADCIMIGDRLHDAKAANANGTRSLGVLYGFGDEAELWGAGVHGLCHKPKDLPIAISSLIKKGGA
jgi:phosphoglycolate phosphatase